MKKKTNIGGSMVLLTLSRVMNLSINLLTVMLMSRYRTLSEYGTYSAILMVVNLALPFFLLGFPMSLNFFYPRAETPEERDRFLSAYFLSVITLAVFAGVLLYATSSLWGQYFQNPNMVRFSYLLAILPWTKAMAESRSNLLVASGQEKKLVCITLAVNFALLFAVLLTKWLDKSFAFYLILFSSVEIVGALVILREGSKLIGQWYMWPSKSLLLRILKFSVPIGLATFVGMLNMELDKLMIGYWFGTETLAIYANAAKELPITIVAASFTAILLPTMTRFFKEKRLAEGIALWSSSVELSFWLIVFSVGVLFVFAPQVIMLLYSEKYLPGIAVFRIYSCVLIWRTTYFGMILNVTGHTKLVLKYSLISLLLNVVMNFVFYHAFGLIGPALATFFSMGVMAFVQLQRSAKLLQFPFNSLFPWKRLGMIIVFNLVTIVLLMALLQFFSLRINDLNMLTVVVIIIVWFVLYLLVFKGRITTLWRVLKEDKNHEVIE